MPKGGQLKFLSDEEVYEIHLAALDILWNIGVRIPEPQAHRLLLKEGCVEDGDVVRIPPFIVEGAIKSAPSRFTIYGRDPNIQVRMESTRVYFQPMIGRLNILDGDTGEKRRTRLEDVEKLVKLADAMENYKILHSGAIMPRIEGVPDQLAHAYGYLASVRNSSKIIKGTCRGRQRALDCLRMAAAIAGGESEMKRKPNIYTTANVISPLELPVEMTEGLIEYAKCGMPVDITSEPQMGATSPVTIAGTLAQQTAEILAGVVVAQVANPGAPVFFGTCGAAMDMRSTTIALGGIEAALINVGHVQMAQFYKIPSRGTGCNTEAKILDMQAGYEKAITLLMPALAGANMIFYPGTIDHAETISLESLLIDNEICGIVYRALEGITVNDETIALDIIGKVGPGGCFLAEPHTSKLLTTEHFVTKISDRAKRDKWVERGANDIYTVAKMKVKEILANHKPLPLDSKVEGELLTIVREIETRELNK